MWWVKFFVSFLRNERGVTLNLATKTSWDAIIPEYWDKAVQDESDRLSVINRLTGPDGSDAAVLTKTDLTKQKGDKITFSTLQRLLGKGVSGTTALEGAEENLVPGTYTVTATSADGHSGTARVLTIERGGVTDPNDLMEVTIPSDGNWVTIDSGVAPLTGSVVIRAFCAAAASTLNIRGGVRRVT